METRFKLWTGWNRGRYFPTLAEAAAAAHAVFIRTKIVLLITEERKRILPTRKRAGNSHSTL